MARLLLNGAAMKLSLLAAFVPILAVACADNNKLCSLLGCANEGIQIDFTHTEAGSYAVDVEIDGTKTSCTTALPLKAEPSDDACTAAGILLTRSGSALPPAEQSISGLQIQRTDAKSVTVRVTRDGQVIHDATFAPNYVSTPGPNGPDCEPKECRGATFALR